MLNVHYVLAILCAVCFPLMWAILRENRSLSVVFPAISMFLVANEIEARSPGMSLALTVSGLLLLLGLTVHRLWAKRLARHR